MIDNASAIKLYFLLRLLNWLPTIAYCVFIKGSFRRLFWDSALMAIFIIFHVYHTLLVNCLKCVCVSESLAHLQILEYYIKMIKLQPYVEKHCSTVGD